MDLLADFTDNTVIFMLVAVTLVLLLLIALSWRNPVLAKVGLRNIRRRPGQSALIVLGLTLGTVIIIAAFGVGDTLRYSVQRQAVSAYGQVDEIVAPPIISMLAGLADGENSQASDQFQATMDDLSAGGLTALMTLVGGGLPAIDQADLARLRTEAEAEPLIDGVAGAIVFPTIIRNVTSGQSEPLGFIYAVDDQYPQNFDLTATDGRPMEMTALEPGIGNIFAQAANLFSLGADLVERSGIGQFTPELTQAAAVVGALLTGANVDDLPPMEIRTDALAQLGLDVTPLREAGVESLDIQEMAAIISQALNSETGPDRTAPAPLQDDAGRSPAQPDSPLLAPAQPDSPLPVQAAIQEPTPLSDEPQTVAIPVTETVTNAVTSTVTSPITNPVTDTVVAAPPSAPADLPANPAAGSPGSGTGASGFDLSALGLSALGISTDELLQAINLNTLGAEIDRTLEPFGLQLRQGEIYLSRLGAERLDARPGDLLEIYIGPLPVRFRVKAVVDQAGPLGAVLPVVMLRLDEAQQLLFMKDRVNAILVSNLGDELAGVEYTDEVSQRLKVLAMDRESVAQVAAILNQPDVRERIQRAAVNLPPEPEGVDFGDDGPPPFIADFIKSIADQFVPPSASQADVDALLAALDSSQGDAALRESLANESLRAWLRDLPLAVTTQSELRASLDSLNQFEQIEPLNKASILTAATVGGSVFASIFSLFGVFSIMAAILLIFLIFVMLAAERRSEIGMARAVGTQRRQVVQMFVTEGMVYALVAAALGVLLGIGATYAMTRFMGQVFNDVTGQFNSQFADIFAITFHISWQSIVIAYCLGVLLTFVVITIASWRVSRMNIVSAIRDLPENQVKRRGHWLRGGWRWLFPLLIAGAGGWLLTEPVVRQNLGLIMIAATLILAGAMLLIGRVLALTSLRNETVDRIVYSIIGLGLLVIWITPWSAVESSLASLFTAGLSRYDPTQAPTVFLFGGPLIIIGAILVIMYNADLLAKLASAIFGFIPALRPVLKTAIAYPLSARFRTGTTMVLFAMIMATVVVMAVVIDATQNLIQLDVESTAGFDIQVSPTLLSVFSPLDDLGAAIEDQRDDPRLSDVEGVGAVASRFVQAKVEGETAWGYVDLSGLNDGYLQQAEKVYKFQARADGYEDDAAVWQALRERDDVVIALPGQFAPPPQAERSFFSPGGHREEHELHRTMGPAEAEALLAGGEFQLPYTDLSSGQLPALSVSLRDLDAPDSQARQVQVIGVLAEDKSLAEGGLQGGVALLAQIVPDPLAGAEVYVKVAEGADARAVAGGIEGVFVANGLNAAVLADRFAQAQELTGGILRLLQGFMALGLLVGIAALGVVSTRSVVERRQQVGMLRALGYQQRMVGFSFLLESSFISMTGLLIGALTGVVLGVNILRAFFPQLEAVTGAVPWGTIGFIVLLAYLFSLLTTIIPAWQASRIYPAEALRYE